MADALLKGETGARLLEMAVAHSEAVSAVDKVEKSVAEVGDLLTKVRSATPLGDIDTCLHNGHVLATYITTVIVPYETACRNAGGLAYDV